MIGKKLFFTIVTALVLVGCGGGGTGGNGANTDNGTVSNEPSKHLYSNAKEISFEEAHNVIDGDINVENNNSVDVYKIHLTPDHYTLYSEILTGTGGDSSNYFHIDVLDKNNKKLLEYKANGGKGPNHNATFEIKKDDNYYIKIYRERNKETVYQFSLYHSIAGGLVQDDKGERNDNKYMATPITFEKVHNSIEGNLNVKKFDTEDWYSIHLTKDTYTVYSDLLNGTDSSLISWKFHIIIYDKDGVKVLDYSDFASKGSKKNATFKIKKDDDYKIRVYREGRYTTYYRFSLFHSTNGGLIHNDKYERNDNIYMATPISFSQFHMGIKNTLNVTRASDREDWYSIELEPDTYTLYTDLLSGTDSSLISWKFHVIIYDEDGVKVLDYSDFASKGSKKNATFTINKQGNYKVKVYREGGYKTYYNIALYHSIDGGLVQDNNGERNDNIYMATPISYSEISNGIEDNVNVRASDREDWYSINLDAGTYKSSLELLSGTDSSIIANKFHIIVYDSDNSKVFEESVWGSKGVKEDKNFTISESKNYKIKIYREHSNKTYYKFSFSKQ